MGLASSPPAPPYKVPPPWLGLWVLLEYSGIKMTNGSSKTAKPVGCYLGIEKVHEELACAIVRASLEDVVDHWDVIDHARYSYYLATGQHIYDEWLLDVGEDFPDYCDLIVKCTADKSMSKLMIANHAAAFIIGRLCWTGTEPKEGNWETDFPLLDMKKDDDTPPTIISPGRAEDFLDIISKGYCDDE